MLCGSVPKGLATLQVVQEYSFSKKNISASNNGCVLRRETRSSSTRALCLFSDRVLRTSWGFAASGSSQCSSTGITGNNQETISTGKSGKY